MVDDLIKKFGIKKLVIIVTFFTVTISGGVTILTLYLSTGKIFILGILLSIVVPGIIAPPQLFFYFYTMKKQKDAEEKSKKTHAQLEIEYKIAYEQQEELKRLNTTMEEIVAERTRELKETLKEKETLLSEIHHRVKNNLQIVISLMQLRKKSMKNSLEARVLTDIQTKIMAMALVHEQLYSEQNFSKINMKLFLGKLISNILLSYSINQDSIKIIQDIDFFSLELTYAIPLCIIITEIITNSLKYAFPDNRQGIISLSIKEVPAEKITVFIRDNGMGCKQINNSSLGLRIINTLVDQMDGTIEMNTEDGVCYQIIIPVRKQGMKQF
jgi:two-component sensor histidine kinase